MSSSPPAPISAPLVPDLLREHPVFQVHASRYRNPEQLPPGAVLVVGAGASGAQIAEELQRAGRRVYLSVGQAHAACRAATAAATSSGGSPRCASIDITPEQRGPARLGPVDHRRLWRPHHRFPQLRRRRHDPARTYRGGA